MKSVFLVLGATLFALFSSSCSHLDTTPPGVADRVVNGFVTTGSDELLPAGTEVWVTVLDLSHGEEHPEVLGEQTIKNPSSLPVPFHIEFYAEDPLLRQSVSIDARVSVGGRLRYITRSRHPLTPGNIGDSQSITVVPASGS